MRRAIVILIVAAIASQAFAAKQVTVEQLEQMLNASLAKPDAELAQQLSYLELNERLSSAR